MSFAPESLKALRRFLAEAYDVPTKNFGIRGVVTPRRPWGYHLGKADIYGPGGMGNRDYSVHNRRDKAGLTNASAGFDIKIPVKKLIALNAFLLQEAKAGRDGGMLVEIIGPDLAGKPSRWSKKNGWKKDAKPARKDHSWHSHVSFRRDTEFMDKTWLFAKHLGIDLTPPEEDEPPLEPPPGEEPIPDNPGPMPEPDTDYEAAFNELAAIIEKYQ